MEQYNIHTVGDYPCPRCGSTKRVFDEAHKALEAKGTHPPMQIYFAGREDITLIDARSAVLSVPTVSIFTDFCYDCGQSYVFKIAEQDAPIKFVTQSRARKN